MDAQVFAFFAAICLGTGIVFGLAPALHVSKTDLNEVLKEGGRSGSSGIRARRWTSVLIVAELALTLVLLSGAGLMMRSFLDALSPRRRHRDVASADDAPGAADAEVPDARAAPRRSTSGSTSGSPAIGGIQAATIATNMPLGGGNGAAAGDRRTSAGSRRTAADGDAGH